MSKDSDSSVRMNYVYINQAENFFTNEADSSEADLVLCLNCMAMTSLILLIIPKSRATVSVSKS